MVEDKDNDDGKSSQWAKLQEVHMVNQFMWKKKLPQIRINKEYMVWIHVQGVQEKILEL